MGGKRKRIEMGKIQDPRALQVTCTKRRQGLFKYVAQLSVLCGCPILVIAFSPGGKPFSFGVSDNVLVRRFFSGNSNVVPAQTPLPSALMDHACGKQANSYFVPLMDYSYGSGDIASTPEGSSSDSWLDNCYTF